MEISLSGYIRPPPPTNKRNVTKENFSCLAPGVGKHPCSLPSQMNFLVTHQSEHLCQAVVPSDMFPSSLEQDLTKTSITYITK